MRLARTERGGTTMKGFWMNAPLRAAPSSPSRARVQGPTSAPWRGVVGCEPASSDWRSSHAVTAGERAPIPAPAEPVGRASAAFQSPKRLLPVHRAGQISQPDMRPSGSGLSELTHLSVEGFRKAFPSNSLGRSFSQGLAGYRDAILGILPRQPWEDQNVCQKHPGLLISGCNLAKTNLCLSRDTSILSPIRISRQAIGHNLVRYFSCFSRPLSRSSHSRIFSS